MKVGDRVKLTTNYKQGKILSFLCFSKSGDVIKCLAKFDKDENIIKCFVKFDDGYSDWIPKDLLILLPDIPAPFVLKPAKFSSKLRYIVIADEKTVIDSYETLENAKSHAKVLAIDPTHKDGNWFSVFELKSIIGSQISPIENKIDDNSDNSDIVEGDFVKCGDTISKYVVTSIVKDILYCTEIGTGCRRHFIKNEVEKIKN